MKLAALVVVAFVAVTKVSATYVTLSDAKVNASKIARDAAGAAVKAIKYKPNITAAALSVAALKNVTLSGAGLTIVQAPAGSVSVPTGTIQCVLNADGVVTGLVGANGVHACAASGATTVPIPVGDGYISGIAVAVAKVAGPRFIGQLVFTVTPRGGGLPTTYACGSAGGVAAPLFSPVQLLAAYNIKAGCTAAPQATGRRLAQAPDVLDLAQLAVQAVSVPAAGTAVPTLLLNGVPVEWPSRSTRLRTNAKRVLAGDKYPFFIYTSTDSGATWNKVTRSAAEVALLPLSGVASSFDGTKLGASVLASYISGFGGGPGGVAMSSDSGATFTYLGGDPANRKNYLGTVTSIASTSDGVKLAVACIGGTTYSGVVDGQVWLSTDSGANWTPTSAPYGAWTGITMAADGSKLAAVQRNIEIGGNSYPGGIFTSLDAGKTWTKASVPYADWSSIASSSDGRKLVAVQKDGAIFRSPDAGATWTQTGAPIGPWAFVASSSTGTKLVAVQGGGGIYTSIDSGTTWSQTGAPSGDWSGVTSSADGTKLVAVQLGLDADGKIFKSADSGATWTQTNAPPAGWTGVASSVDGSKLVAVQGLAVDDLL